LKKIELVDDGHCFACGEKNQSGLKLEFRTENGKVFSKFIPQKIHQGFKNIVHGGIISTILDEAMMKAVLYQGIDVITAEIAVRFKNPLHVGDKAFVEAEIKKMGNRLIETSARMKKNNTIIIAEAHAKLLKHA
jgi:acyl-coenzyme A thioesterase PaaI-like protein